MNNYEMPIWFGEDKLTSLRVIDLGSGELLIESAHIDERSTVRSNFRVSLEVAELLAANILTAIRATQLKEAA